MAGTLDPGAGGLRANLSDDGFSLAGMWKLDDVPIDWSRARTAFDIDIWDENQVNVTDWPDLNWAGHDPVDWYPMDLRFTAVVIAPGEEFSGWENYP